MDGCLEEDRPNQPVGPEERESVRGGGRGLQPRGIPPITYSLTGDEEEHAEKPERFTWFTESLMSKPLGESHSKRNIMKVAAWMATTPTNIQEAVSKGSRKAVGDIIPVRLATMMAMPVSMNGTLKSTCNRTFHASRFSYAG